MSSINDLANGRVTKVDALGPPPYGMRITGIGGFVPENVVTNDDLAKLLRQTEMGLDALAQHGRGEPLPDDARKRLETSDEWIVQRTGIKERRFAAPDQATSDLAAEAIKIALDTAERSIRQVDFLICGTVTPDHLTTPATAAIILRKLGLAPLELDGDMPSKINQRVFSMDVSAACSTFGKALQTAYGFIRSGLYRRGIVVGADTLERVANQFDRTTCPLFSSAAGAVIVEAVPLHDDAFRLEWFDAGTDGRFADKIIRPVGGSAQPYTIAIMQRILRREWERPDSIRQDGRFVFEFMVKFMADVYLPELLERTGLKRIDAVDHVFFHQANGRMIDAIVKRFRDRLPKRQQLNFPRVHISLDRYANPSSPTVPITYYDVMERDWQDRIAAIEGGRAPRPILHEGDLCLACVMGGGFTWASSVFYHTNVRSLPLRYLTAYENALLVAA